MSALNGDREIHRSGTGVLTIGKEIGLDRRLLNDFDFDKSPKDIKLLFINPPVDFSVFYSDMDLSDTKSSSPPIGILHLAAMAKEYGYPVKLVDAHAKSLKIESLLKIVGEFKPDVICLTAMTIMIDSSSELAKAIKEYNKDIIIMIGGVHLTAEPIKTMEMYLQFDFGVVGEGEIVLIDFLELTDKKDIPIKQVRNKKWSSIKKLSKYFPKGMLDKFIEIANEHLTLKEFKKNWNEIYKFKEIFDIISNKYKKIKIVERLKSENNAVYKLTFEDSSETVLKIDTKNEANPWTINKEKYIYELLNKKQYHLSILDAIFLFCASMHNLLSSIF